MFTHRIFRPVPLLAAALLAALTTACSGGGGSAPTPASGDGTTATFVVKWPVPGAAANAARRTAAGTRRPDYLSDGTKSVTILVQGNTTEIDNPNVVTTAGATPPPTQTSTSVQIPVVPSSTTPVTFTVSSYDKIGAAGNLLDQGSLSQIINPGVANQVLVTLNGNLGEIGCTAVPPTDVASGTSKTAFTQIGIAGDLVLTPMDADGYTIVMPGTIPSLALTPQAMIGVSTSATSTQNEFGVTITPAGTAENFTASGTNLAGTSVTATCTITRDALMYVANPGKIAAAGQPSITIYDATVFDAAAATTAQKPFATIEAPAGQSGTSSDLTGLSEPQYVAVDANGYLFVSNLGPLPGVAYSSTSGYVAIYAPGAGQSGNVAPVAYIKGLNHPEGLAFDTAGNLYVMSTNAIDEYPPTADGVTAPAAPSNVITSTFTYVAPNYIGTFASCYGLAVDPNLQIYAACSNQISVFAPGATGGATPTDIELPQSTSSTYDSVSWIGIATDSAGNFYAPAANNNIDQVYTFPANSTSTTGSTTSPAAQGSPTSPFSQPAGIGVDASNGIYVTNFGSSTVDYFSSSTVLTTGKATSTLSGAATGLNYPYGVVVR